MDQFRPRDDQDPVREIERSLQDLKALLGGFLKGSGTWLVIGVVVLLYLASGFYIVGPGEKGVELLFGGVRAVTDPGLRYRAPWPIMSQIVVDVAQVRRKEIGYRSADDRTRTIGAESLMLTGDENIVDVQLFVQYMVKDPKQFLFGARDPEAALVASAEVALRGVVGENTIDYTMTSGRMEVQNKVEAYLQKLMDTYQTGLQVTQARLLGVDPPSQVKESFHDVVKAWEDRERLIKEADGFREDIVPKARGQAQKEILEAEAYKAQRVIKARGDAQRFTTVLQEYAKAPKVTQQRLYLEGIEQFLGPTRKFITEKGDSRVLPLLPLTGTAESLSLTQSGKQESEPSADPKKRK
ncbi:MAG: FtsH protease activity modulator HflK [Desulfomonile tiedjei]|nr:FtsH protease activity modulator HflK [Desulfomonile tiedjei]